MKRSKWKLKKLKDKNLRRYTTKTMKNIEKLTDKILKILKILINKKKRLVKYE